MSVDILTLRTAFHRMLHPRCRNHCLVQQSSEVWQSYNPERGRLSAWLLNPRF